jgi:hypothetical protein
MKTMMPDAKFYIARRDTRWDVYPQTQPEEIVAYDWYGCWKQRADGSGWYLTPTSYVLVREITDTDTLKEVK